MLSTVNTWLIAFTMALAVVSLVFSLRRWMNSEFKRHMDQQIQFNGFIEELIQHNKEDLKRVDAKYNMRLRRDRTENPDSEPDGVRGGDENPDPPTDISPGRSREEIKRDLRRLARRSS